MKFQRASGILLHPTSLPGGCGIGDLGSEAYRFADFLKDTGQHLWQMLPVNPTGYGNSPYQCTSVFAGNPLLINLDKICDLKLLSKEEILPVTSFPVHKVDFDKASAFKQPLLNKAYNTYLNNPDTELQEKFYLFCSTNAHWLDDYVLFMAYKENHQLAAWNTWEEDIRSRDRNAIALWQKQLDKELGNHQFQQFLFFEQWKELKTYCNGAGIKLIGDIPIFIALDSDTVWAHPEYFQLNNDGTPAVIAGVPPDYFSSTGQLWGNPLYNWQVMREDGYVWWLKRFQTMLTLFDIVRIDHFRGFESYWEIPGNAATAIRGRWVKGPGTEPFEKIRNVLGNLPIIAEDLGIITTEVEMLRDQLDFPGMKVLQFAFGDDNSKTNKYLPHNFNQNCIVYTGTHDNNTTIGWFNDDSATTMSQEEREKEKQRALYYLGTNGNEINWDFIRLAFMSVADMAIIPMQDVLGLGSEARMNTPGSTSGNWRWRFRSEMLTHPIRQRLHHMSMLYGR